MLDNDLDTYINTHMHLIDRLKKNNKRKYNLVKDKKK